jgi:hypothetical protein
VSTLQPIRGDRRAGDIAVTEGWTTSRDVVARGCTTARSDSWRSARTSVRRRLATDAPHRRGSKQRQVWMLVVRDACEVERPPSLLLRHARTQHNTHTHSTRIGVSETRGQRLQQHVGSLSSTVVVREPDRRQRSTTHSTVNKGRVAGGRRCLHECHCSQPWSQNARTQKGERTARRPI